jgi:hypothetical protein
MRPLLLVGVLLIGLGGYLLFTGGTFTTRKQILDFGDVKVTAPDEHTVPRWVAGVAVLVGLGLVVVGAQRRGQG